MGRSIFTWMFVVAVAFLAVVGLSSIRSPVSKTSASEAAGSDRAIGVISPGQSTIEITRLPRSANEAKTTETPTKSQPTATQSTISNDVAASYKGPASLADNAELIQRHAAHLAKPLPPPPVKVRPIYPADARVSTESSGEARLDYDWLASTKLDANFKPTFHPALEAVDGKSANIVGHMSPLDQVGAMRSFMLLEYPLGCYFCFAPELTGIVLIEMKEGLTADFDLTPVRLRGRLVLNRDDPNEFVYKLVEATLVEIE